MKKFISVFILSASLFLGFSAKAQSNADFFAGKWKVTVMGTPNGDASMTFVFDKKEGKLTGTVQDSTGTEIAKIEKIEESGKSHCQNDEITKTTEKTKVKVKIPIIPELRELLNKYWNNKRELPAITNQKGNEYLKEIGKAANLTRPFNYEQIRGNKIINQTYEAWQMVSWHVARHSFITNCVQLGVSPKVVQKLVGHTTFKMMERYVQNDDDFNKQELMKYSGK